MLLEERGREENCHESVKIAAMETKRMSLDNVG